MSLVIGLSYRDQFVIVSNDSKVTLQGFDPETLESIPDQIFETGLTSEKVHRITDKVLMSATGRSVLTDLVEKLLMQRVKSENDLAECTEILGNLLIDLRDGLVEDLSDIETDSLIFLGKNGCFNLFGFNHNGVTGLADFNQNTFSMDFIESPTEIGKGYPVIIQSPNPEKDRQNFYQYLKLPAKKQTIDNFASRFVMVHAYLSSIHKGVSTDCNFHILFKDGESIKYQHQCVESEDFYDALGLMKEI